MKAIIKWTWWQRRWSTLWWSVGMFALIFFSMIFYPVFRDQAAELQKSFDQLPDAAVQLFGGSTDFFSPVGYLNSQVFYLTLPIVLGILAIVLGSSLIAREEQDRTIEHLLARPVSRSRLLVAKGVAGTIILAVVSLVVLVTTVVTAKIVDMDISLVRICAVCGVCFLMAWSFGAIAFAITCLGRARIASLGIAMVVAFGGYIVSSLATTVEWLRGPSKAFPFDYYKSESILLGTYNWKNIIFFLSIIAACAIIAWLSFRRRDLS